MASATSFGTVLPDVVPGSGTGVLAQVDVLPLPHSYACTG
jgi:hypothetical protein